MRDDSRSHYDYNMDVSRTLAQRGGASIAQMSSSLGQYSPDLHLLGSGGMPASYRSSGYAGVGAKGYYVGAEWTDAYGADGGVDYALSCSPYQVISNDPVPAMGVSYGQWAGARQKSTNQAGSVYNTDSDSGYAYGTGANASLVHRPAVSVPGDTSAYSFSSIAASLPTTTNERLLPTPVSRAVGSSSANYRTDALPSVFGAPKSSHGSSVSGGTTGQTPPVSPVSDVATAAAVVSYAGAAYDYTSSARSSQHQGGSSADAYTSVSSGAGEAIFGDSDRNAATQGSAVDLTAYTYGGSSPADTSSMRRASSGSGLTSRSAADTSASSAGYVESDAETPTARACHGPAAPHPSSSSHGHGHHHHNHHHHYHHGSSHHASPRHGGHHLSQQQHAVTGGTTYGESSSGGNAAGVGVGSTAAAASNSHRTSIPSRR